jgi:hypothetical protein
MLEPQTVPVKSAGHATVVSPIYEVGVQELHRVSQDESVRRQVDADLNEARGRDGARLHVTLKAITEADRRAAENTRAAMEAVERIEDRLTRLEGALSQQVQEARTALWTQADGSLQSLSSQSREATDRVAVDIRKLRDEVVSLVDSRMNQADASFAALRGDVEVVKYLVMDLIKDRIGRKDPTGKAF